MRYGIISDLHLDHYPSEDRLAILNLINRCGADHLLIAGDLGNGHSWEGFLKKLTISYSWVRGNHDYYGDILESDYGVQENTVYASLWTNFREDAFNRVIAKNSVSDFYRIKNPEDPTKLITPEDELKLFAFHWDWIRNNPKDIILTHFPPSIKSIADKYQGDPTNPYFVNDIPDEEIQAIGAKLWVHGHVHSAFDYMIGETRIICNPLGYPGENFIDPREYQVVMVDI